MKTDTPSVRPLYIWGPQLEFVWHGEQSDCGPCELYELTSMVEAFTLAPKLMSAKSAKSIPWVRDGLGSDIAYSDITHRAASKANLGEESALVQWENIIRSSDATPEGRVEAIRVAVSQGNEFLRRATSDSEKFFGFFLEEGVDIVPSPEYAPLHGEALSCFSISRDLLNHTNKTIASQISAFVPFFGSRFVNVPPLTAILLSRCRSSEDIPEQLLTLRSKYRELRAESEKYELQLARAQTLGDQLDALQDLEKIRNEISLAIAKEEGRDLTRSVIRHAWDVAKQGSLLAASTKAVDLAIEKFWGKGCNRLAAHFVDIYGQLREVKGYATAVERVFGSENVRHSSFREFEAISKKLGSL